MEVARRSGLSVPTCWKIETGIEVGARSLAKYGEALSITADQVATLRPRPALDAGEESAPLWEVLVVVMGSPTWAAVDRYAARNGIFADTAVSQLVSLGLGKEEAP